jgi:hypothetical protein
LNLRSAKKPSLKTKLILDVEFTLIVIRRISPLFIKNKAHIAAGFNILEFRVGSYTRIIGWFSFKQLFSGIG